MGLKVSHGCWSGGCGSFMAWRLKVAEVTGYGNVRTMENFYGHRRWPSPKGDALIHLLNHSDCEGELPWEVCEAIADRLGVILPALRTAQSMEEDLGGHLGAVGYDGAAEDWMVGLRLAAERKENVVFHG